MGGDVGQGGEALAACGAAAARGGGGSCHVRTWRPPPHPTVHLEILVNTGFQLLKGQMPDNRDFTVIGHV